MGIKDNLKILRERYNLSQKDIAEIVGMSDKAVSTWESGTREPRMGTIEKIASHFGLQKSNLIEDGGLDKIGNIADTVSFDVIGDISAGYDGIINEEKTGDSFAVPLEWIVGHKPTDFILLKVRGNSMSPLIQNNDICLILKQETMDYSGQIGAVIFEDSSVTLKKVNFVYGEDWMELEPLNQKEYRTMRIENESLEHCRVIGILKKLIRTF